MTHGAARFGRVVVLAGTAALGSAGRAAEPEYSASVDGDYPINVYWGDTHLHTRNSADAYSLGNMNLAPADAYRFAQGQVLTGHNGKQVKLRRRLDFLVVSDHAEYLDGYYRFAMGDRLVTDTDAGRQWRTYQEEGEPRKLIGAFTASIIDPEHNPPFPELNRRLIWQDVAATADLYDRPGAFTAFIGYEWTSMIDGNNLHRVVIYKDAADKAARFPPFSAQDSTDPRDLWAALARYAREAGDGEAHPRLSPDDEFADFETWDWDNIARTEPKQDWMLQHEYARGALKLGLGFESSLGVNPFKFGVIGSTDGHNTFSTTQEDNFWGIPRIGTRPIAPREQHGGESALGQLAHRRFRLCSGLGAGEHPGSPVRGHAAAGGLCHHRVAYQREVLRRLGLSVGGRHATGLSRHRLRQGRADGRGPELGAAGGAATFMVLAAKDPDGANLDRIQIIKGWRDAGGDLHENVYDVVWSGDRQPDRATGVLPPVGSTVDVERATFTNSIGAPQLAAVWRDPQFDPRQRAFYYARVIEIPRPRWTTHDAASSIARTGGRGVAVERTYPGRRHHVRHFSAMRSIDVSSV